MVIDNKASLYRYRRPQWSKKCEEQTPVQGPVRAFPTYTMFLKSVQVEMVEVEERELVTLGDTGLPVVTLACTSH